MSALRIIHLLDDGNVGGVTANLRLFDDPYLRQIAQSETLHLNPKWSVAPVLAADVVIMHCPVSWAIIPFLISLRTKNPGVQMIHMEHHYSKEWEAACVTHKRRFRSMLRMAYGLFHRVICVSKAQKEWLSRDVRIARDRLHIIQPWSMAEGLTDVALPDFRADKPLTIGCWGRFTAAKGFDRVIDAFTRANEPDLRLLIGGFGDYERELWQKAVCNSAITFYGKVERAADFLSQCDVVIVPSDYETYGIVASEAMQAGRPVITALAGGLPEQVGRGGVSIDCQSVDSIARALADLRLMPLAAMSVAARAQTIDIVRHCVGQWVQFLGSLSASGAPTGAANPAPIKISAGQNR
jgi:glycosyltransferase involved in cell wall biosynthesis